MSEKQAFSSPNAPKPIGPYSPLVKHGKTVYISGQLGIDPVTNNLVEGLEAQTERAMLNIAALLAETGYSMSNLLHVTIFLTDLAQFGKVNEIYGRFLTAPYPARAVVETKALPKQALIEITAIAGE
jgi:2-iminobutanoate/2-iminopropanoate deaminase